VISRSVEMTLTALSPKVPAFGYTTVLLRPRRQAAKVASDGRQFVEGLPLIENEHYRVEADTQTGSLTITEIQSGLTIGPAAVYLDDGEAGDLYTHYAPSIDTVVEVDALPRIEREIGPLGQSLQIQHAMQLPVSLGEERAGRAAETVTMPITTRVTLLPDDPLVRFVVTVDNRAADHRLRVHTTVPFSADHAHVVDSFAVLRRLAQPDSEGQWAEQPVGTAPHQGAVAIHGA